MFFPSDKPMTAVCGWALDTCVFAVCGWALDTCALDRAPYHPCCKHPAHAGPGCLCERLQASFDIPCKSSTNHTHPHVVTSSRTRGLVTGSSDVRQTEQAERGACHIPCSPCVLHSLFIVVPCWLVELCNLHRVSNSFHTDTVHPSALQLRVHDKTLLGFIPNLLHCQSDLHGFEPVCSIPMCFRWRCSSCTRNTRMAPSPCLAPAGRQTWRALWMAAML